MTDTATAPSHPRRPGDQRTRAGSIGDRRTEYDGFTVSPLTPHIGAEVEGVDRHQNATAPAQFTL